MSIVKLQDRIDSIHAEVASHTAGIIRLGRETLRTFAVHIYHGEGAEPEKVAWRVAEVVRELGLRSVTVQPFYSDDGPIPRFVLEHRDRGNTILYRHSGQDVYDYMPASILKAVATVPYPQINLSLQPLRDHPAGTLSVIITSGRTATERPLPDE